MGFYKKATEHIQQHYAIGFRDGALITGSIGIIFIVLILIFVK